MPPEEAPKSRGQDKLQPRGTGGKIPAGREGSRHNTGDSIGGKKDPRSSTVTPEVTPLWVSSLAAEEPDPTKGEILVGNGSLQLLDMIVRLYLEEGDTVLVEHPSYPSYDWAIRIFTGREQGNRRPPWKKTDRIYLLLKLYTKSINFSFQA